MKPQLLNLSPGALQSFSGRRDLQPDINSMWHYHLEMELVYFKRGSGIQFVGDSIENFADGDVVLVGSNLPHYWRFDPQYFSAGQADSAEVYVIHFREDFWGRAFLELPENQQIKKVISRARHGIRVSGPARETLSSLIPHIIGSSGPDRVMGLVDALKHISRSAESRTLASIGFELDLQTGERDRIQAIYNYTIHNHRQKISLEQIAGVAGMSPNSFCKFFRSRNRKTFTQFLSEIRIGQACKLLIENKLSVKQVCYECGFQNFSSFHKSFRTITGKTPLKYLQEFIPRG